MTSYDTPKLPYVEAKLQGGKQKPTAIIIRPSFTHSRNGAALAVAQVWHRGENFWEAAHYSVDEAKRFRCVNDRVIAGVKETDRRAIRIAVCAEPYTNNVFWDPVEHSGVLENTARLVAELTLAYNIRTTQLDDDGFERWSKFRLKSRGGIYVTEPNGWSKERFASAVNFYRTMNKHI